MRSASSIPTVPSTSEAKRAIDAIKEVLTGLQEQGAIAGVQGAQGPRGERGADGTATVNSIGPLINSATSKATPIDTDHIGLMDSEASNILKKLSWANLKATLKTYFDSLYALATHNQDASTITTGTIDGDRLPAFSTTKKAGVPATGTPSGKFLKDDGTWAEVDDGQAWGDITGTLADQTDLQAALDAKYDSGDSPTFATVITTVALRLKGYTVATLPAGTQGDTCYVTDALAPTFLATVVGGGAIVTPVFFNGTNWVGH